jgi:hypothetical protein
MSLQIVGEMGKKGGREACPLGRWGASCGILALGDIVGSRVRFAPHVASRQAFGLSAVKRAVELSASAGLVTWSLTRRI